MNCRNIFTFTYKNWRGIFSKRTVMAQVTPVAFDVDKKSEREFAMKDMFSPQKNDSN